jgi:spermidine/putrescine-binding protein
MTDHENSARKSEHNQQSGPSRRRFVQATGLAGTAAIAGCLGGFGGGGGDTVNVLTWEGYGTDAIIDEFESEFDATVNISLLASDSEGFNILQSGGVSDYDILTLNNTWAARHAEAGTIEPLAPNDFPEMDNFLDEFQWPVDAFAYDDEMYALPTRWGWDTLTVNDNEVPEEHHTYEMLWTGGPNGEYENKTGIMDWPTWNIPKIAQSLGYPPFDQTEEQLDDIREKLVQIFENVRSIYSGTSAIRQAFLQEDIVISPVGNFTMSELRADGNEWVNVIVPEEGGMQWTEGMSMVKDPNNRELALEFMKQVITPEGQYSISWEPAAKSPPVNTESFDLFDDDQQTALMFDEDGFDAAERISQQTTPYEFSPKTDTWTDMWENAKAQAE